jgi:hypothetical protein
MQKVSSFASSVAQVQNQLTSLHIENEDIKNSDTQDDL